MGGLSVKEINQNVAHDFDHCGALLVVVMETRETLKKLSIEPKVATVK